MAAKTAQRTGNATTAEAAAYLGVAVKTLLNWHYLGIGPRRVGRGRGARWPWTELEAWNTARIH